MSKITEQDVFDAFVKGVYVAMINKNQGKWILRVNRIIERRKKDLIRTFKSGDIALVDLAAESILKELSDEISGL